METWFELGIFFLTCLLCLVEFLLFLSESVVYMTSKTWFYAQNWNRLIYKHLVPKDYITC